MDRNTKLALAVAAVAGVFFFSKKSRAESGAGAALAIANTFGGGAALVKPLAQGDPRWASLAVGFSQQRCALVGCVLTTLTMATNALRGTNLTPPEVNEIVKRFPNGFSSSGSGVALNLGAGPAAHAVGLEIGVRLQEGSSIADVQRVTTAAIAGGGLAAVRVIYDEHDGKPSGHTVLCFGSGPEGLLCADPANGGASSGKIITIPPSGVLQRIPGKLTYTLTGTLALFRGA